jgi:hypothetical protein
MPEWIVIGLRLRGIGTKPATWGMSFLLLATLLSGCIGQENSTDCSLICSPNQNGSDYKIPLETFGFRQLAINPSQAPHVAIDDSIVAWHVRVATTGENPGQFNSGVVVYDIETDKIHEIAVEPYYHRTLVDVSDGRVLYEQLPESGSPDEGAPPYLEMWDSKTNSRSMIGENIEGAIKLRGGFDGEWAFVTISGSENMEIDGAWLLNVDSAELKLVYKSSNPLEADDGRPRALPKAIDGNNAAYLLTSSILDSGGNSTSRTEVAVFDINTESNYVVWESNGTIGRLSMSERFIVWEELPRGAPFYQYHVRAYDLETGRNWVVSESSHSSAAFPSAGGDWVTYFWRENVDSRITAVNLVSGQSILLLPDSSDFSMYSTATDGEFVAGIGRRKATPPFETLGQDVYLIKLKK